MTDTATHSTHGALAEAATAFTTTAADLTPGWQEAAAAYLTAEAEHGKAREEADREEAAIPDPGPMPEGPDPEDFASPEALAEAERIEAAQEWLDADREALARRIDADAERNPAYREARDKHALALEAWHRATADERNAVQRANDRAGLDIAAEARRDALQDMEAAARALLSAPVCSQADALAACAVLLFAADLERGLFEDAEKIMGADPDEILRALSCWLPASPAATPIDWQ